MSNSLLRYGILAALLAAGPLGAQSEQQMLASAEARLEQGDYQDAQTELDLAMAKAVPGTEVHTRISRRSAETLLILGRYRDAAVILDGLGALAPPTLRARYLAGMGRYRDAVTALGNAPDAAALRLELLLAAGDLAGAGRLLQAPEGGWGDWLRGEYALLTSRRQEAAAWFERAHRGLTASRRLVQDPQLAMVCFRLAEMALEDGALEPAEEFRKLGLAQANTIGPLSAWAKFLRGRIQLASGQPEYAAASFRAAKDSLALDVEREAPPVAFLEAWQRYAEIRRGQPEAAALDALQKRLAASLGAAHPRHAQVLLLAAEAALAETGEGAAAVLVDQLLAAGRQRYPELPLVAAAARSAWAARLVEARRYSTAVPYLRSAEQAYTAAGAVQPAARARFELARALASGGDFESAEPLLRKLVDDAALKIEPHRQAMVLLLLGETDLFRRKYVEAAQFFEKALGATADPALSERAGLALAESHFGAADYQRALRVYTAVLRKPAQNQAAALGWCRLGRIYSAETRPDESISAYNACWQFYDRSPAADAESASSFLPGYVETLARAGRMSEAGRRLDQWISLASAKRARLDPVALASFQHVFPSLEKDRDAAAREVILRKVLDLIDPAASGASGVDWVLEHLAAANRQLGRFAEAGGIYERLAERQGRRRLLQAERQTLDNAIECWTQARGKDAPEVASVLLKSVNNLLESAGWMLRQDPPAARKLAVAIEERLAGCASWEQTHPGFPRLEAERIYLQAKHALLTPDAVGVLRRLDELQLRLQENQELAAAFTRRAALLRGRGLLEKNDYPAAMAAFSQALVSGGSHQETGFLSAEEVNDLAYALERTRRADEAERYFREHQELCRSVFGRGSEEEAISLKHYADYLDRRNRRKDAIQAAEQAQKLFNPASRENAEALQRLAFLYARDGQPLRGVDCLRQSAALLADLGELEPSRQYLLRETAHLLHEGRQFAAAAEAYGEMRQVALKQPKETAAVLFAWKNQTLSLENAGRHDQAKALAAQLRQYLKKLPKSEAAAAEADFACAWADALTGNGLQKEAQRSGCKR